MKAFTHAGARAMGIVNLVETAWREMSTSSEGAKTHTVALWKKSKRFKLRVDETEMREILIREIG